MNRQILCALDTADLEDAVKMTRRLSPFVGGFKVGHALTLGHGLDVVDRLRDAGASRIFLDLKFHDIPNSVALAVCEAAKRGVWMMTLHITGGPAMLTAAAEQASDFPEDERPLLVGVSVLTSLDEKTLQNDLGVGRGLQEHMVALSKMAMACELDGVVCGPQEVSLLRGELGKRALLVTPGIRLAGGETHDQARAGDPNQALADGASYLVVGRALTDSTEPEKVVQSIRAIPS
ncbi:orotidine-5'-phosphate decarboxylase [bacterium]|nr:MAG: orotidine-5'-phosphate decarboxylase [bacterium]